VLKYSGFGLLALVVVALVVLLATPGPAAVEGTGTHFEVTDSDYLNITLDSSELVTVVLESVPRAVTLHIEAADRAATTELTLGGFGPDTEYHLYEDDYHNHTPFTTDGSGSYTYLQDLASAHLVMIQPYPSTIFLSNSGWSRTGIGAWDPATKTGTLTTDVSETIQIDDSGIVLDGNGHVSATTTATRGVFVKGNVTGVVVRNLTITGYTYGVDTGNNCHSLTVSGNWISDCTKGISLFKCDHSAITSNTVSFCSTGIDCQTDRNAIGNAIYWNCLLGNSQQASVSGNGAPFLFNLTAPTGGNYWSDWTSPDANHDGFVDNPYVFVGGTDLLPWAVQNGWETEPPTTTVSLAGTLGSNGWYRSDVTVTLAATDTGGSGLRSTEYRLDGDSWTTYGGPFSVTTDGSHTLYYRSTDNAGNVEDEQTAPIKEDKTPPTLAALVSPAPNALGWNKSDVTVSFVASDTASGVDGASVTPDIIVTSEGAGQPVSGCASDLAGNTGSITIAVSIDKTPPTLTGAATSSPNAAGWYNHELSVHFVGSDALSGLASVTPDASVSTEGAGQSVAGIATDKAGNSATFTVSGINIDKTPPTLTGTKDPSPNAHGWNNTDVTVHFTASDALSGVDPAAIPADVVFTAEGAGQSVTRSVTDRAGNTAEAAVGDINIDKTPPVIAGAATTSPNANGWYKEDVTIHFTGSDALSGLASVTPDATLAGEGAGQSAAGIATDKAGNSATFAVSGINIDKTPPVITVTVPAEGGSYSLHAGVTVNWSVADGLSGIATATGTVPSGSLLDTAAVGDHTFHVEAADRAGNDAEKSVVYHVRYLYSGVLPPVNLDGRSLFKLGSTIPVKFQLRDAAGAYVANATATLLVAKLTGGVLGDEVEAVSTAAATAGNLFRCDASGSQYIFNLSTKPLSVGTWQMRISMDDGNSDVVLFSLR
jgi:parallel beta-helix repeat protein